jgi:hypothetical protein
MGWTCGTYGGEARHIQWFRGETLGKEPLGRPRLRWVVDTKMDLKRIGFEGVDLSDLAQDRNKWRVLLHTVMNHKMRGIS